MHRKPAPHAGTRLRLRFSLWQNGLPTDALPSEGWMELRLLSEEDLIARRNKEMAAPKSAILKISSTRSCNLIQALTRA